MNFSKRTFIIVGAVVIAAVILLAVFVPRLMPSDTGAKNSESAIVRRGNLVATVSATGSISPLREAQLAFSATGSLMKLEVKQGDVVKAAQVIAALDTRELELQLAQTEASLASAQARFDQLKNPSPADVAAAQAGVASAEAALIQLRQPTQTDLIIAKADLDKARAALDRAQAEYDRIGGSTNPMIGMLPQAVSLQQASSDYQKALALFNAKIKPSDSQLLQAQSGLEQARAQLARLNNPNSNEVKNAQAAVDQARASRDLQKLRLDYAIIKAPFDGVVTRVEADLGSTVTAGRVVIAVADVTEYRVKLNIDETDIAQIKAGQQVIIGLDAYRDVSITAQVTEVASAATTIQGVVNYIVTVTLLPGQAPIKIGMTADANIVIAKKDNVLLAPNRAIRAAGNQHFVTVPKDSELTEEIEVKIGLANDQDTEIVSGLTESQVIIISLIQQLPGGGFGMPRR